MSVSEIKSYILPIAFPSLHVFPSNLSQAPQNTKLSIPTVAKKGGQCKIENTHNQLKNIIKSQIDDISEKTTCLKDYHKVFCFDCCTCYLRV